MFRFSILAVLLCAGICSSRTTADEINRSSLSQQAMLAYSRADRGIKDFDGFLKAIEFENPAIIGTNYFAISMGGINAIRDLEEGRGVDPETFAGLHAGFARPEVAEHLNLQKTSSPSGELILKVNAADRRLRYKGTVVRLYSPTRLQELYDRRDSFRISDERKRRSAFAEYVFLRRREFGDLDQIMDDRSEAEEMARRYRELQPLLSDLQVALQSEVGQTSILQGTNHNFFSYSIGGVNALADLRERFAVDPETLGAIYAQRVSSDYAGAFQYSEDGRVSFEGNDIRLYSVPKLIECFKRRDRLSLQTIQ